VTAADAMLELIVGEYLETLAKLPLKKPPAPNCP
jgi:hypothetical protein